MRRRGLEGERAQRVGEKRKHNCYSQGESLFKQTPARAPKRHGKSPPARTEATRPMTRGPRPTSHLAGVWISKKANRHARSESPRLLIPAEGSGSALDTAARAHESFSLGIGLRVLRRRTVTQGANHRVSSSPSRAAVQSLARGPGPRVILFERRPPCTEKANRRVRSTLKGN